MTRPSRPSPLAEGWDTPALAVYNPVLMPEHSWDTFARVHASQRWRQPSAAMGRCVTEAIVSAARVEPGMRVLDVACGSGEPAISIATLLRDSGRVIGADISPGPLQLATQRARERGLRNLDLFPRTCINCRCPTLPSIGSPAA